MPLAMQWISTGDRFSIIRAIFRKRLASRTPSPVTSADPGPSQAPSSGAAAAGTSLRPGGGTDPPGGTALPGVTRHLPVTLAEAGVMRPVGTDTAPPAGGMWQGAGGSAAQLLSPSPAESAGAQVPQATRGSDLAESQASLQIAPLHGAAAGTNSVAAAAAGAAAAATAESSVWGAARQAAADGAGAESERPSEVLSVLEARLQALGHAQQLALQASEEGHQLRRLGPAGAGAGAGVAGEQGGVGQMANMEQLLELLFAAQQAARAEQVRNAVCAPWICWMHVGCVCWGTIVLTCA